MGRKLWGAEGSEPSRAKKDGRAACEEAAEKDGRAACEEAAEGLHTALLFLKNWKVTAARTVRVPATNLLESHLQPTLW